METSAGAADREGELVALAASFGDVLAAAAERHDRDGTFVEGSYRTLRDAGLLAIGVPEELGGRSATIREVAMVQRELARHCASTALATSMHQHLVAVAAWRYRRGMPGAEALLRRVAEERVVLVATGGADFTRPRGDTTRVAGGYRVNGVKIFASQSPAGTLLVTMFPYQDPAQGLRALGMTVPLNADGVRVAVNWDALGMRGTGSNDVIRSRTCSSPTTTWAPTVPTG
ncbi:MAG: acyl-CoA dehydrogenase family protein [Acidimicrobiales bacterium]